MNSILNALIFGAGDISQDSLTTWVVGAVMFTITGVLGFLARDAFVKIQKVLEVLGDKMDMLKDVLAKSETRNALLDARVATLERDFAEMRREIRELSEGIAR